MINTYRRSTSVDLTQNSVRDFKSMEVDSRSGNKDLVNDLKSIYSTQ